MCALVFQVWLGLFNSKKEAVDPRWTTFRTAFVSHLSHLPKIYACIHTDLLRQLLIVPYIVYGAWATAAAWLGIQNPERISRNRRFFYCSLELSTL